jgi:hypothetical protein
MKLDALARPVTKENVAGFLQTHAGQSSKFVTPRAIVLSLIVATIIVLTVFLMADPIMSFVMSFSVVSVFVIVAVILVTEKITARKNANIGQRLEWLAKDNGWTYRYRVASLGYTGSLFSAGHTYEYSHIVSSEDFDIGRCTFLTGSGKSQQRHHYGFIAMRLKKHMPHMLLDTKSNNLKAFGFDMSNLPVQFSKSQKVSLEGDFDKYYTLYAPGDYGGVDVRYIFTPDLMQLLIENSTDDIEIIDDKLYVYMGRHDVDKEEFWHRVEKFRSVLGSKLTARAGRYDDDRTVDASIAPHGRRLKKGVSAAVIFVIIIYLLSFLLEILEKTPK